MDSIATLTPQGWPSGSINGAIVNNAFDEWWQSIAGFDNTYQKIMNIREIQTLNSLVFMSSLQRKRSRHFSTFISDVIKLVPT